MTTGLLNRVRTLDHKDGKIEALLRAFAGNNGQQRDATGECGGTSSALQGLPQTPVEVNYTLVLKRGKWEMCVQRHWVRWSRPITENQALVGMGGVLACTPSPGTRIPAATAGVGMQAPPKTHKSWK